MRQFKSWRCLSTLKICTLQETLDRDITVFIRLGSDFTENYYEYEIPIEITPWGVGKDSTLILPVKNRITYCFRFDSRY